jgi:hypothetical protein
MVAWAGFPLRDSGALKILQMRWKEFDSDGVGFALSLDAEGNTGPETVRGDGPPLFVDRIDYPVESNFLPIQNYQSIAYPNSLTRNAEADHRGIAKLPLDHFKRQS